MSGSSDFSHPVSIPPLKAYDRSNLRSSRDSTPDGSPKKFPKKAPPVSAFAASGGGGGGGGTFTSQAFYLLLGLIVLTFFLSLRYFGTLSGYMLSDDLSKSPVITSIQRHEAKQTEQMAGVIGKVEELNDRTSRSMMSLSTLLEHSTEQHKLLKEVQQLLREQENKTQTESKAETAAEGARRKAENQTRTVQMELLTGIAHVRRQLQMLLKRTGEGGLELGLLGEGAGEMGAGNATGVLSREGLVGGKGALMGKANGTRRPVLLELGDRLDDLMAHSENLPNATVVHLMDAQRLWVEQLKAKQGLLLRRMTTSDEENAKREARLLQKIELLSHALGEGGGAALGMNRSQAGTSKPPAVDEEELRRKEEECRELERKVQLQSSAMAELQQNLEAVKEQVKSAEQDEASSGGDGARRKARISPQEVRRWHSGSLHKSGSYGFISYSSYRLSRSSFVTVGFGIAVLREFRKATSCIWANSNSRTRGRARLVYPDEARGKLYEAIILICDFDSTVPSEEGHLAAYIDRELVLLYKEAANQYKPSLDPTGPFPSQVSVCVTPLSGRILEFLLLSQFIEFHRLLGTDHFVLYDVGALGLAQKTTQKRVFGALIDNGILDVVEFGEMRRFDIWNFGQAVALQDCMHKLRYKAEWVMYAAMDDYLWFPQARSRQKIPSMLSAYKGQAGVTIGSLWFSIFKCRPREEHVDEVLAPILIASATNGPTTEKLKGVTSDVAMTSEFQIERFVYHWPEPACFDIERESIRPDPKLCQGERGHRRFIVNPRMVEGMGAFGPMSVESAHFEVLSTDEVVFLHYDGIGYGTKYKVCNESTRVGVKVDWWVLEPSIQRSIASMRNGKTCNFLGLGCTESGEVLSKVVRS